MMEKKVALFDYFDTVVHRKCHPETTKKIWAARIKEVFGLRSLSVEEIYQLRAVQEKLLCNANKSKGYDLEFSAKECYECLLPKLGISSISVQEFCDIALSLEVGVECSVQYLDQTTLEILKKNKQRGLKNVLVSDFYLPQSAFNEFLEFFKISDLFDEVFVSSEYLRTKRTGALYQILLETLGLDGTDCSMYGDNCYADKEAPEKFGISAVLKNSTEFYRQYNEMQKKERVGSIALEKDIKKLLKDTLPEAVFPEFAFTVFCAIKMIISCCERYRIRKVAFLAREGRYIKPIFDYLVKNLYPNHHYETYYLYVSRRSTFLPSLKKIDEEDFSTLFRQYTNISPKEFFKNLGLDEFVPNFISKYPLIDFEKKVDNFSNSCFFQTLLADPDFLTKYDTKRSEQFNLFGAYLCQTCGTLEGNVAIVDVGWKGTIQDNLEKITNELRLTGQVGGNLKLYGLYFGLDAGGDSHIKSGLLFDFRNSNSRSYRVFSENRTIFETILAADHGSTLSYKKQNGTDKVEPVLAPIKESSLFFDQLQPMLESYVNFCSALCDRISLLPVSDFELKDLCTQLHSRMVFYPTEEELCWFNSLFHEENFGTYEDSVYSVMREKSLLKRAINGIKLIKNRTIPVVCSWPFQYISYCCGQPFVTFYRFYKKR